MMTTLYGAFRACFCPLAALCTSLIVLAPAYAGPPWDVDDPETTPAGAVGIEMAWVKDRDETTAYASPDITVTYGITDTLEAGLNLAFVSEKAAGTRTASRLDHLRPGLKYRFLDNRNGWRVALAADTTVKTGDVDRLGGSSIHHIYLAGGYEQPDMDTIVNLGVRVSSRLEEQRNQLFGGLLVTTPVRDNLLLGVQVHGNTPAGNGSSGELFWGVGLVRELAGTLNLEGLYGRSFTSPRNQSIYLGFSTLLVH